VGEQEPGDPQGASERPVRGIRRGRGRAAAAFNVKTVGDLGRNNTSGPPRRWPCSPNPPGRSSRYGPRLRTFGCSAQPGVSAPAWSGAVLLATYGVLQVASVAAVAFGVSTPSQPGPTPGCGGGCCCGAVVPPLGLLLGLTAWNAARKGSLKVR
jgi:hypothetical protein